MSVMTGCAYPVRQLPRTYCIRIILFVHELKCFRSIVNNNIQTLQDTPAVETRILHIFDQLNKHSKTGICGSQASRSIASTIWVISIAKKSDSNCTYLFSPYFL